MLRWLQSTVQFSGGYGYAGFRLHVTRNKLPLKSIPSFRLKSSLSKPVEGQLEPAGFRRVVASSDTKSKDKDHEDLYQSLKLKRLSPESIHTLYESARTRSQLEKFSPRQLSIFISVFGTASLPPDAPRITNDYVDNSKQRSSGSGEFWEQALSVAKDKQMLGYKLNRGDHYWAMWAWIAKFRTENRVDFLSNATTHYHQIWRDTRSPDILMLYFEALLSSEDQTCLQTAVVDLCGLLGSHSNLHGRSLRLIWDLFLSLHESLNPSLKNDILLALWNRSKMTFSAVKSHYLATHMYNQLTKRHERLPLDVSQLVASLGAPLFPFFHLPVPISVQQWGRSQLRNVLSPSCSTDVRWANFSLFALYQTAQSGGDGRAQQQPIFDHVSIEEHFSDWHVVLTLVMLENVVVPGKVDVHGQEGEKVRGVLDALWDKWERILESRPDSRPIFVSRAIISAFLKLAARTRDEFILNRCRRYAVDKALWRLGTTAADRVQVEALVGDYVEASVRCRGKVWGDTLRFLEGQMQEPVTASSLPAELIIQQLLARDVHLAHDFYEYCLLQRVHLGTRVTTLLAVALAPIRVHAVYPILERGLDGFDFAQLERVLLALLNALREERYPYLTPASTRVLGRALIRFLSQQSTKAPPIPPMLKYPLRYPLTLLVASGSALDAVRIVEMINGSAPSFLNERFLKRLLGSLLRHQEYSLAARLYRVVDSRSVGSSPAEDRFRQKLILGLNKGGASLLTRHVLRTARTKLSIREEMVRRVTFRGTIPTRKFSARVLSVLHQNPSDIPSIKHALSILIQSKRPIAAKRLFQQSLPHLDQRTITWFGNFFLHRILRRFGTRNVQVVKKLFRAKRFLKDRFGFVQDRVTFNVFVKAVLRWKSVDANRARTVFDECVRVGYPVGERWRRINGVPFGTRPTSSSSSLPFGFGTASDLSPHISFARHVRPLYKMFIKAFYTRKDVVAAKTVVGILKNEEAEELARQQKRNRARVEGLRKAKASSSDKGCK